jgi:hypothetical protein
MVYPLILMYWIVLCIRVLLVLEVRNLDVGVRLSSNILFLLRLIRCDLFLMSNTSYQLVYILIYTKRLLVRILLGGILLKILLLQSSILGVCVVRGTKLLCF